jgi:CheY-like chemotaxis protein
MSLSSTAHSSGPALKILVADDDEFLQRLAILLLQDLGYSGVVVDNGEKVLACLAQRRFDVVLLDIMMPVMDGMATLAAIRRQEKIKGGHQLVIMATAHNGPNDRARLAEAGADGYVAKPFSIVQLRTELQRVIALR